MTQLVLITRPEEQARQFAKHVEAIGLAPFIHPLLHIESIPTDFADNDQPDAVILSSVQALEGLHIPPNWSQIPVFCVGEMSALAAEQKGFQNVIWGQGGIEELSDILKSKISPSSELLYIRGEHVHQNLHELLDGYNIRELISYRAQPLQHFAPELLDVFSRIHVVTLFSTRTANIFKDLIEKNALTPYLKNIKLLSLSPSVVESVKEMGWKSIDVADYPTQAAMIEKLKSV